MDTDVERKCAGFDHMISSRTLAVYGTQRHRGPDGRFSSETGIWCDLHRTDPSPTFKVIDSGELRDLVKENNL